jgi:hypothetical protein
MTDYTLFGAGIPSGTSAFTSTSSCDISLQVQATGNCLLKGYRWWVPSGGDTAGANRTFRVYSTANGTSGTLISAGTVTGSGTWGTEAWNSTLLGTPVSLSAGTSYLLLASCVNDSRRYLHSYWASGGGSSGITSGPVTAPSKAAALGGQQQLFRSPSTGAFLSATSDGELFCFDLVAGSAAASPSGLLMAGII